MGGRLFARGGVNLGGLLQEFRQLFVRHGIYQDTPEDSHEPWFVEVAGQDVSPETGMALIYMLLHYGYQSNGLDKNGDPTIETHKVS